MRLTGRDPTTMCRQTSGRAALDPTCGLSAAGRPRDTQPCRWTRRWQPWPRTHGGGYGGGWRSRIDTQAGYGDGDAPRGRDARLWRLDQARYGDAGRIGGCLQWDTRRRATRGRRTSRRRRICRGVCHRCGATGQSLRCRARRHRRHRHHDIGLADGRAAAAGHQGRIGASGRGQEQGCQDRQGSHARTASRRCSRLSSPTSKPLSLKTRVPSPHPHRVTENVPGTMGLWLPPTPSAVLPPPRTGAGPASIFC